MDWMKIASAGFLVLMLVYLWPRAKHMFKNSPKASGNDVLAAIIPLLLVLVFIFFLIKFV
ncbi:MAG: hypothetical protein QNL62_03085 [Gammaproteobacteria bacterium]|nr:hypothetical protein [Gammaproteobacteria bacterium]